MIYTHHANFTFETSSNTKNCFNENEIKKYYSGNNKETNDTLFNRISNEAELTIVLPDLFEIIKAFSKDTDTFIELITENKLFRDELNQKCTFANYYELANSGDK